MLPSFARCQSAPELRRRYVLVVGGFLIFGLGLISAAALFPDLLQRFLPFPIGLFDRSRALDGSIESAWHDMIEDAVKEDASAKAIPSPFERPFLDLWTPARADEAVPALIINTTEVANGYRIVMSPIGVFITRRCASG